jgi:hypothetical protein
VRPCLGFVRGDHLGEARFDQNRMAGSVMAPTASRRT